MAGDSAIGALSVRAARSTTCVLDGWATLGAGNRARVPGPDEGLPPVPAAHRAAAGRPGRADDRPGRRPARTGPGHHAVALRAAGAGRERRPGRSRRPPSPGRRRTRAPPGSGPSPAPSGRPSAAPPCRAGRRRWPSRSRASRSPGSTSCPPSPTSSPGCWAAARSPSSRSTSSPTRGSPASSAPTRAPSRRRGRPRSPRIDAAVGRLRAAVATMDDDTLVLLAGISEVNDGRPQLHVGMAEGPGFDPSGWLTSSSTGRAPFAQLIDVAPTALAALGLDQPASMNGQPMRSSGTRPELARAVQELDWVNTGATVHHRNTGVFFWTLVLVSGALVALGHPGARRPPRPPGPVARSSSRRRRCAGWPSPRPRCRSPPTWPALVPWERSDTPLPALVGAVLAADLVVTADRPARAVAAPAAGAGPRGARHHLRHAPGRRVHRIDARAQRAARLRRDRRRPLHRVRQPHVRADVGQRAERHRRAGHRGRAARRPGAGAPRDRRHRARCSAS